MVQYFEGPTGQTNENQDNITMDVSANGVNTFSISETVDSSDTDWIGAFTLTQAQIGTDNSDDLPYSSNGTSTFTVDGTITNAITNGYSDSITSSNEYISSVFALHSAGQQANETYGYEKKTTNYDPYPGANAPDVTLTVEAGDDSPLLDYSPVLVGKASVQVTIGEYNDGDSITYAYGGNGALSAVSIGAPGSVQKAKDSTNQAEYYGGNGGDVTLSNEVDITVEGYAGDATVGSDDALLALFGDKAYIGAITAYSLGGQGQYEGGVGDDYAGPGGPGGDVSVTQSGDVDMHGISNPDGSNFMPSIGLWAISSGGPGVTFEGNGVGNGGDAGDITVSWTGGLTTGDDVVNTTGIVAGSVGGSADLESSNPAAPGNGGDVTVDISNDWNLAVGSDGYGAIGVFAFSAGGQQSQSNDASGYAGDVSISADSDTNMSITGNNLGFGLLGLSTGDIANFLSDESGTGVGNAGEVSIENDGSISVSAQSTGAAFGIVALSAGGYSQIDTFSEAPSGGSVLGFSGDGNSNLGSNGVSGQAVSVTNTGTVTVSGPTSSAIMAMSVGGSGGLALYLADAAEGITDGGFMNLGSQASSGFAGGGDGGPVRVDNTGTVVSGSSDWVDDETDQYNNAMSFGIVAQSIGGGGGAGTSGRNIGGSDVGGQGGGYGSSVSVTHGTGSVTTYAAASSAIIAQSIGGGGGAGGNRSGIGGATGGSGGNGGDGGKVTVDINSGDGIYTVGDFSFGVVAQSIGGGGGAGGSATADGLLVDLFSMATGGSGGSGGSGDSVTVSLDQTFVSSGARAVGIVAQSIGGGGGTGAQGTAQGGFFGGVSYAVGGSGGDGGNGGTLTVTNESNGVIMTGCDAQDSFECSELSSFLDELDDDSSVEDQSDTVSDWTPFGTINLQGADAIGIMAQSIGGGGGDGGTATSGSSDDDNDSDDNDSDISFSIGIGATAGAGGAAGVGGTVTIDNDGAIITAGDQAYGILAQSISGGGGNGGDATASSFASGLPVGFSLSVTLGGDGGAGDQDAGDVTITNGSGSFDGAAGSIVTFGQYSTAILAQSIGGGGGTGGAGSSSSTAESSADGDDISISVGLSVSIGGSGGTGNDGGDVSVSNELGAAIRTLGAGSRGILAQSIGGGGGSAGAADAAASSSATGEVSATISASASVGGSGGAGGDGGAVTVVNDGLIYTGGILTGSDGSTLTTGGDGVGIFAQSIGGGGGTGGSSTAETTVGASEDDSDDVNATQSSVGSYSANVSVGGAGGASGDGGTVSVTNTGQATTTGMRAHAIFAQSIGGGGGAGGSATSTADNNASDGSEDDDSDNGTAYAASIAVGGTGGGSGNGGEIDITQSGAIVTYGYGAAGINAQSIGGGGGQGADGTVSNNVDIQIGLNVSSSGGAGGDGGTIDITTQTANSSVSNPGSVATMGDDAIGIFAQSIGGGGGTGAGGCTNSSNSAVGELLDAGVSYLEDESASLCFGNTEVDGDFSDGTSLSLSIGGSSGNTGDGGTVTIDHQTAITTFGDRAIGIVAQSIGGGGGFVISANDQIESSTVISNTSTSESGVGGLLSMSVDAGATIQTFGDGAWGLLAQSIGGGGGFAGDPSVGLPTALSGASVQNGTTSSGIASNASGFDISVSGKIETSGTAAHAIFAQAIGGGGGYLTDSDGTLTIGLDLPGVNFEDTYYAVNGASSITIADGASVLANGASSVGIFAQSVGAVGPNPGTDVTITVDGTVSGGTGGLSDASGVAAGIYAQTANGGTITIGSTGTLTTADGVDGYAVYTPSSDAWTITNAGTLTGAVFTGAPTGGGDFNLTVTNTGTFNFGQEFTSSYLINQGKFSIGGDGNIYQSTAYDQSYFDLTDSNSNWLVDIDATASDGVLNDVLWFGSDSLSYSTAAIGGTITPNVIGGLLPQGYGIINAPDGLTLPEGSAVIDSDTVVTGSYLYSWDLAMNSDNTALDLTPSADFTPSDADLTSNEENAASYLGDVWDALDEGETPTSSDGTNETDAFAAMFGALYQVDSASDYEDALSGMTNAAFGAMTYGAVSGSQTAMSSSLSCPQFEGESMLLREHSCYWGKASGGRTELPGDNGATIKSQDYRVGGQIAFADNWILGGSAAYVQSQTSNDDGSFHSDGEGFNLAAAVKYDADRWYLAAVGTVGYMWNDNQRNASMPGLGAATVTSHSDTLVLGTRFRAAYEFPFERWYVRPRADLDILYAHTPGYTEKGSDTLAMQVGDTDYFGVTVLPAVEFGGQADLSKNWTARLFGTVGASISAAGSIKNDLSFVMAPDSVGPFTIETETPKYLGNVGLGLQIYSTEGLDLRADYNASFGGGFENHSVSLKLSYVF